MPPYCENELVDNLVTWLRVQLDEDERIAGELGELDYVAEGGLGSVAGWSLIDYLKRFGSARALAEVDAKRNVLDRYADAQARQTDPEYSWSDADVQVSEYEDWILPALALPYADRPGYRDEWRP